MKLFFIVGHSVNGDNLDQLVVAETSKQAVELWCQFWSDESDVEELNEDGYFLCRERVFEVPASPFAREAHVLSWFGEVPEVGIATAAQREAARHSADERS